MKSVKIILGALFSFVIASAALAENRIGVSAQFHMFSTSGTETLRDSGKLTNGSEDNDVVVPSIFLEYMGDSGLGVGIDYVPVAELGEGTGADDDAETSGANKASAELASHVTLYTILEGDGGYYGKLGVAFADVDTTENLATGDSYGNASTEGLMIGLGYSTDYAGYIVRGELTHTAYDSVTITSAGGSSIEADMDSTAFTLSIGKAF